MKKIILVASFLLITGCGLLPPSKVEGENYVLTTTEHVVPSELTKPETLVIEYSQLPPAIQDAIQKVLPEGEVLVATQEKNLVNKDAPRIPIEPKPGETLQETLQDPSVWNTILNFGNTVVKTVFPEYSVLATLALLLFRRQRKVAINAVNSVDKVIDGLVTTVKNSAQLKGSKESLSTVGKESVELLAAPLKAVGVMHSDPIFKPKIEEEIKKELLKG